MARIRYQRKSRRNGQLRCTRRPCGRTTTTDPHRMRRPAAHARLPNTKTSRHHRSRPAAITPGTNIRRPRSEHRRPEEPAERRDPQAETGTSHATSVAQRVGAPRVAPGPRSTGAAGVALGRGRCTVTLGTRDQPTSLPPRPRRAGGAGRRRHHPGGVQRRRGPGRLHHLDHRPPPPRASPSRPSATPPTPSPSTWASASPSCCRPTRPTAGAGSSSRSTRPTSPRWARSSATTRLCWPSRRPPPPSRPPPETTTTLFTGRSTTTTEPTPTTEGPTTTTTAPGPLVQIVSYAGRSDGQTTVTLRYERIGTAEQPAEATQTVVFNVLVGPPAARPADRPDAPRPAGPAQAQAARP